VFATAREKARAVSCLSNIKQITLATIMYAGDWDETLPMYCAMDYAKVDADGWVRQGDEYFPERMEMLLPYIGMGAVPSVDDQPDFTQKDIPGLYVCPDVSNAYAVAGYCSRWYYTGYGGIYQHIAKCPGVVSSWWACCFGQNFTPTTKLGAGETEQPSKTILWAESVHYNPGSVDAGASVCCPFCQGLGRSLYAYDIDPDTGETCYRYAKRHNGGNNLGFCDGHAKWMSTAKLTSPTWPDDKLMYGHNSATMYTP